MILCLVLVCFGLLGLFLKKDLLSILLSIFLMFQGVSLFVLLFGGIVGFLKIKAIVFLLIVFGGMYITIGLVLALLLFKKRGNICVNELHI